MMPKNKKSVLGPVISVFVVILVTAIIASLTFLLVAELKDSTITTSEKTTLTVVNESGAWINRTPYTVATANKLGFDSLSVTVVINTTGLVIASTNYTVNAATGVIQGTGFTNFSSVNITYTYSKVKEEGAYNALNKTEKAGADTVDYLPLIFIALIFGALLTLVLKIILPYINLGQQVGQF